MTDNKIERLKFFIAKTEKPTETKAQNPKENLFGFTLLVWHKCFGNKQQTNTCYYCCDYYYYYYYYYYFFLLQLQQKSEY